VLFCFAFFCCQHTRSFRPFSSEASSNKPRSVLEGALRIHEKPSIYPLHPRRISNFVELVFNRIFRLVHVRQLPPKPTDVPHKSLTMVNLFDLISQKIELFRLEQRYTRRRNRRSTFVSEAQYVDGEYIYSPTSTYSAKCSAGGSDSEEESRSKESKGSRRLSKMGLDKMDWRKGREEKRQSRISVREVKWDEGLRT